MHSWPLAFLVAFHKDGAVWLKSKPQPLKQWLPVMGIKPGFPVHWSQYLTKTPDSLPDLIFLFFFGLKLLKVWCKHHCLITYAVMHRHKDWACTGVVLLSYMIWQIRLLCFFTSCSKCCVGWHSRVSVCLSLSLFFAATAVRCYFVAV